ncbi:hypothetical protein LR48_Vigan226s001400 [Vigna angularis]|uniref:Uncharacterized protein n=1 Tax=Phaseolus angularis TaxID=3914 RepID=A0A0L9T666_PHAAN|nr:hypothetical protein LR48_Vigan226s001400 [Vigna angularis]
MVRRYWYVLEEEQKYQGSGTQEGQQKLQRKRLKKAQGTRLPFFGGPQRCLVALNQGPQRQSSRSCAYLPPFGALSATLHAVLPACPYPGRSALATCHTARLVAPLRALSTSDVGP